MAQAFDVSALIAQARDLYFEGLLAGYFGERPSQDNPFMAGWKCFPPHKKGGLIFFDTWRGGSGCISIRLDQDIGIAGLGFPIEVPFPLAVWHMVYETRYPEGSRPLLTRLIRPALEQRAFVGGRGIPGSEARYPRGSENVAVVYSNQAEGDFDDFRCTEEIRQRFATGEAIGQGRCRGGLCLPRVD